MSRYRFITVDIVKTRTEVRAALNRTAGRVGLAATMGALHDGHVAVTRAARAESDVLVASLFVNPAQFEGTDDFQTYPRPFERDMDIFEREGVDLVWAPPVEEVYPEGFETYVEPGPISHRLEGESTAPDTSAGWRRSSPSSLTSFARTSPCSGQKDWQQTRVIETLIRDLDFDIEMPVVPTVRNGEGLALSSRNRLLSDDHSLRRRDCLQGAEVRSRRL